MISPHDLFLLSALKNGIVYDEHWHLRIKAVSLACWGLDLIFYAHPMAGAAGFILAPLRG
ncbi:MAG: hypothetical protein LAO03_19730 [Acidobacteriia bacterium]|nr:hypothetical protein [Terriglobia bacterium]